LTNIIDKIPRWKLSTVTLETLENSKAEKSPGVKKTNKQKTGPKS